jgi:hypothetical protein
MAIDCEKINDTTKKDAMNDGATGTIVCCAASMNSFEVTVSAKFY